MTPTPKIRWPVLLLVLLFMGAAGWLAQSRLSIETDITASLPEAEGELSGAAEVLKRNPNLDRVVIDLGLKGGEGDPDLLVETAGWLNKRLEQSGLFKGLGSGMNGAAFSGLFSAVLDDLPALFSEAQLQAEVAPLLTPQRVRAALSARINDLAQLDGMGQADALSKDPLGLARLVLARLSGMMPASNARIYRNQLISGDGAHLLLLATPAAAGSDTAHARRLLTLFNKLELELNQKASVEDKFTLTVVGGFRAALDNETLVRADTRRAIIIATVGIALLLLLCFPRPWLGLLALLPALAGLSFALLIFSLFEQRISGLALGFGGALVSITVDHGVAFLLFLDQTRVTTGKAAARKLWAVGLFATLTTVGAFSVLTLSGFPILRQVGLLAALGVGLAFLFVHTVLPLVFPAMPAARRGALLPLQPMLARLTSGRTLLGPALALLLAAGLLPFAKPTFEVDLAAMNTVQPATLAAEKQVTATWGDVFDRVYLLASAKDLDSLRHQTDAAAALLERAGQDGQLAGALSPSSLLPGPTRATKNRAAWTRFWNAQRRTELATLLSREGQVMGFTADAFAPFSTALAVPGVGPVPLPAALHELLGISRASDGGWVWFGSTARGKRYDSAALADAARRTGIGIMDPRRYTRVLATHLSATFQRMLKYIALAVVVLMIILFLDPLLVLISLLPLAFAFVATLGTLGLLGHPIDIPGLMLVIVIFGMGIDYALFLVRAHQRFLSPDHPGQGPVRGAVFLAAGSTLIGMLSLTLADHAVPRSAGITASAGVLFAALGAFLILPPLLRRLYQPRAPMGKGVVPRYRRLSPNVRLSAYFKVRLDPMFPRLDALLDPVERLLDVGCGYGVPAAWLMERRPALTVVACEADEERALVAARALGDRASVHNLAAPALPPDVNGVGAVLMLDMVHHLDDGALAETLASVRAALPDGGQLILRATVPGGRPGAWERWLERINVHLRDQARPHFRGLDQLTAALERADFELEQTEPTAPGREETWLLARARRPGEATR